MTGAMWVVVTHVVGSCGGLPVCKVMHEVWCRGVLAEGQWVKLQKWRAGLGFERMYWTVGDIFQYDVPAFPVNMMWH